MPADGPPGGGATSGCDAYHDDWWTVAPSLGSGTYVLSVQTSKTKPPNATADASINSGTNAENMWSIEAPGGLVYGNGRMAVYNNLQVNPPGGGQQFYLAKIDERTGAGKTAQIDIFDAGDVTGDATLKVYSPDNNVQTLARFSYTTDGNCVVGTSDACSGNEPDLDQDGDGGTSTSTTRGSTSVSPCRRPTAMAACGRADGGRSATRSRAAATTPPLGRCRCPATPSTCWCPDG